MEIKQVPPSEVKAVVSREEIDVQISTAKAFPRDIETFAKQALAMATFDDGTAQECIYTIPRAGKNVTGPSVRMAEIIASCWGNLHVITRPLIEEKHVRAQAVVWDLERNLRVSFEVLRRITYSNGGRFNDDMIQVTAAAASAIAFREAVKKGIPQAIWKGIEMAVRRKIAGTTSDLPKRRASAIAFFAERGVEAPRLLARLGRQRVEDITIDDVVVLRGISTAITDGDTTLEGAFPAPGVRHEEKLTFEAEVVAGEAPEPQVNNPPVAVGPPAPPPAPEGPEAPDENRDRINRMAASLRKRREEAAGKEETAGL